METESALCHLTQRLFLRPFLNSYPVNRTHRSRPIRTVLAVDQNGETVGIGDDLQKTHDIFPFRMPGFHEDVFTGEAGLLEFIPVGMKRAQVDDRFDAQTLEVLHPGVSRLGASIQGVADFVEVGDAL